MPELPFFRRGNEGEAIMKLRIKGNSLRIRLTKSEVSKLAEIGYLEETTVFPNGLLVYTLQKSNETSVLFASFENNTIKMFVPNDFVKEWPGNNVVGIDSKMQLPNNELLYLLLEKDFVCLDETTEDQSDHFENPNKAC